MGISADTIQLLMDAGMGGAEMITIAKAGERGDDYYAIWQLIEHLKAEGTPSAAIAAAAMALARSIIDANQQQRLWRARPRDEHSRARDGNRQRRGMSDSQWRKVRARILERDEWTCQYCGSEDDLTCDHVIPLIRGGGNDDDNLTTACRSCNSSKGDKLIGEWVA
jgi:hypothetical protein